MKKGVKEKKIIKTTSAKKILQTNDKNSKPSSIEKVEKLSNKSSSSSSSSSIKPVNIISPSNTATRRVGLSRRNAPLKPLSPVKIIKN